MLNKNVCQQCINMWARVKSEKGRGWDDVDDRHWRESVVVCPYAFFQTRENVHREIDVKELPPPECIYAAEHMVSQSC
jgi:hypothetical protein